MTANFGGSGRNRVLSGAPSSDLSRYSLLGNGNAYQIPNPSQQLSGFSTTLRPLSTSGLPRLANPARSSPAPPSQQSSSRYPTRPASPHRLVQASQRQTTLPAPTSSQSGSGVPSSSSGTGDPQWTGYAAQYSLSAGQPSNTTRRLPTPSGRSRPVSPESSQHRSQDKSKRLRRSD